MATAFLIRIDGWDPVAAAAVVLRLASHDDVAICALDGQDWFPVVQTLPQLRFDGFDGDFSGRIVAPSASLSWSMEPWPLFGRYALADARCRIWMGDIGAAWGAFTLLFDGRLTAQPILTEGIASAQVAVDDRWLDAPLLGTYAGTGGAEGPAAIKGVAKPLALGAPRFAGAVLVDVVNSIYQVSAAGAIEAVEAALDQVVRLSGPTGDHADYAALVAASVPAGSFATSLAAGLVKLGAPPFGRVSFMVQGDKSGPDGWVRKPGAIIKRIALLSGGSGKIDTAALTALDSARPYNQSLWLEGQTTARDVIQDMAASVNAVAGVNFLGQLFAHAVPDPASVSSPSLTLAADGTALPAVGDVRQIGMGAPWWRIAILAARSWIVHSPTEIAFVDPPTDGADGADGDPGAPGDDGFAASPASVALAIAAFADGTVKSGEFNKVISFALRQGVTDLSDDGATTYEAGSLTNIASGWSWSGTNNKVLTITGMTADAASLTVTIKRSTVAVATVPVTLTKVRDGFGAAALSDDTLTINNTGSYSGEQGGPLTLTVGPSGTVRLTVTHNYSISSGARTYLAGKVQYRTTPGSGAWTDIGSETADAFGAAVGEPATLSISETLSGPGSSTNWEFRYVNRRSSGSATMSTDASSILTVQWSGV